MDTFLLELAKSGPWAVVAGFLLWKIIGAWTADRAQVTQLIGKVEITLNNMSSEIGNLAKVQTRIMEHLERDTRTPAGRG
jgi:hypothetical protein